MILVHLFSPYPRQKSRKHRVIFFQSALLSSADLARLCLQKILYAPLLRELLNFSTLPPRPRIPSNSDFSIFWIVRNFRQASPDSFTRSATSHHEIPPSQTRLAKSAKSLFPFLFFSEMWDVHSFDVFCWPSSNVPCKQNDDFDSLVRDNNTPSGVQY